MRKVLHVLAPGDVGGLESVVRALAWAQQARGHAVAVAAVVERAEVEHPWVAAARAEGIPVIECAVPPRAYHRERAEIIRLCQTLGPEVVHTHGYRSDVIAGGAATRLGFPVVTTVHGFTGGGLRNRFYEWLQVRSFRRFSAVVAVSRPLRDRLAAAGVPRDLVRVIPNAYRVSRGPAVPAGARAALGLPGQGFRLGWVGRLSREKGLDVLIDALALLRDLPIELSVLGTGRESTALMARAEAAGVNARIRWHGTVADAGHLFAAFDCFVLSSRTEGTPIVLFEAMAAGVPIITTSVGGVPDVVSTAEAVLVPPDDPAALARAIRATYADRDAATARAEAARRRLDASFGVSEWVERYDTTYEAITSSRARVTA